MRGWRACSSARRPDPPPSSPCKRGPSIGIVAPCRSSLLAARDRSPLRGDDAAERERSGEPCGTSTSSSTARPGSPVGSSPNTSWRPHRRQLGDGRPLAQQAEEVRDLIGAPADTPLIVADATIPPRCARCASAPGRAHHGRPVPALRQRPRRRLRRDRHRLCRPVRRTRLDAPDDRRASRDGARATGARIVFSAAGSIRSRSISAC